MSAPHADIRNVGLVNLEVGGGQAHGEGCQLPCRVLFPSLSPRPPKPPTLCPTVRLPFMSTYIHISIRGRPLRPNWLFGLAKVCLGEICLGEQRCRRGREGWPSLSGSPTSSATPTRRGLPDASGTVGAGRGRWGGRGAALPHVGFKKGVKVHGERLPTFTTRSPPPCLPPSAPPTLADMSGRRVGESPTCRRPTLASGRPGRLNM